MPNRNLTQETAIFGLWLNWVIAGGALFLPNILSVYIPPMFIPVICFVMAAGIWLYDRSSIRSHTAVCPLIPGIAMRALLISAVTMVVISIIYKRGVVNYFYEAATLNPAIPFVTALIISPITFAVSLWARIRDKKFGPCRDCVMWLGTTSERGFLGKLFVQESRYQLYFLLAISAVLTLFTWIYYAYWYVNVNINIPDKFVFGWVPVVLFVISIFYLGARCFTIWAYYYQDVEGSDHVRGSMTSMRVLVIIGDSIYLHHEGEFNDIPDANKFDTPASLTVRHTSDLSLERAATMFSEMSMIDRADFTMRYMYTSHEAAGDRNTFHFICCPSSPEVVKKSILKGKWYNISQLTRLFQNQELAPLLAAEIHRLYTVTMAWKTYDIEGRRLYKVKHYHPLFRLQGICDWDVDFNSSDWLNVARLNEDKPFFRLRRFFNRLNTIFS